MTGRSGTDPQNVIPGVPSPGGRRIMTPNEVELAKKLSENPIVGALAHNEQQIMALAEEVQLLKRNWAVMRISLAAMRTAIMSSLGDKAGQEFTALLTTHEAQHGELHNLFVQMHKDGASPGSMIPIMRDFNATHDVQVMGYQFGLPQYLNENPDNLSEEECAALAAEFNVQAMETAPEVSDDEG